MILDRELRTILAGLLVAFMVVALAAAYWAAPGRDALLAREDNPRLVEARAAIQRGAIYDRNGVLLVSSETTAPRSIIRRYQYPETYSAIGYYSLRYGVGGIEADYDRQLSGAEQPLTLEDALLQNPVIGSDIRISLNLELQQAVVRAMGDLRGAVIVLSVPDGELLASVSLPTYDPNTLDQDWETLLSAPGNPFFNRALQGRYQPGTALQTPLMASLLLAGQPIDTLIQNAAVSVRVDDLQLSCAEVPPQNALTLQQAYAFACPAPFALLTTDTAVLMARTRAMLPVLPSANTILTGTPVPTPNVDSPTMLETLLGQGADTVSPLSMVMLAAAILNDGNAPQPETLLATRAPDSEAWAITPRMLPTLPIMTDEVAQQLQFLMRDAAANGAARPAAQSDMDIGGHAALAYAGEGALAWFIGFSATGAGEGFAVAVVLENVEDAALAAQIGGIALQIVSGE
jgi:peptidoglycan glycosyltransferase